MPSLHELDARCQAARNLAHNIAPHLAELRESLRTQPAMSGVTASAILLQAAAGFLVVEEGRLPAVECLDALREAAVGDLLEPQMY